MLLLSGLTGMYSLGRGHYYWLPCFHIIIIGSTIIIIRGIIIIIRSTIIIIINSIMISILIIIIGIIMINWCNTVISIVKYISFIIK